MNIEARTDRGESERRKVPLPASRLNSRPIGSADDIPFWQAVSKLYAQDKVEGAYDLAERLGAGRGGSQLSLFRLIDAEYDVRVNGTSFEPNDWLKIEYFPNEQGERVHTLARVAIETALGESARFGWAGKEKVVLSLLSIEKDAPWATARFGYCARKTDYYKICVPHHATGDDDKFADVFGHEFAHVMSLSQSKQRVSTWLGEGFSVYVSNEFSERSRQVFLSQPRQWLAPNDLGPVFSPIVDLGGSDKWLAYQQAGWITRYLAKVKGEKELMNLLGQFADESFFRNLKLLALGESRTTDAINAVYGFNTTELFERAWANLRSL